MKLNRDDMHTYGQSPSWDGLVLVTCEKCARNVKIESLESHVTLRHGSKSERTAFGKVLAARSAAAIRHCQVRLEPVVSRSLSETPSTNSSSAEKSPLHSVCFLEAGDAAAASALEPAELGGLLLSGSSSSTSPQPVSFPSSPPGPPYQRRLVSPTSSVPVSPAAPVASAAIRAADSASAPDTRSPSPDIFMQSRSGGPEEEVVMVEEEEEEAMEVDHHQGAAAQPAEEVQDIEMVTLPPPPSLISSSYQEAAAVVHPGSGGSVVAAVSDANAARPRYMGEEADSTTAHNVISIPDTEDIPNIEIGIISEGDYILDSINTKYNVSLLKTETASSSSASPVDSTTTMRSSSSSSTVAAAAAVTPGPSLSVKSLSSGGLRFGQAAAGGGQRMQVMAAQAAADQKQRPPQLSLPAHASQPRIISLPIRTNSQPAHQPPPQLQQQPDKMEVDSLHPHVAPTHYITVSPLSKTSPKKPPVGSGGGAGKAGATLEKKAGGREREYDPNKHCGVWDGDAKRNCTRSLTCKSHSVYLKRKVNNRAGSFDELLAAHKADKDLSTAGARQGTIGGEGQGPATAESHPPADSQSILARRLQLAPTSSTPSKAWEAVPAAASSASLLKPAMIRRPFYQQQQQQQHHSHHHQPQLALSAKEFYCDENLHFSTGEDLFLLVDNRYP
jgi:hypothetical protein